MVGQLVVLGVVGGWHDAVSSPHPDPTPLLCGVCPHTHVGNFGGIVSTKLNQGLS
jgi:hypothetical protein